MSARPVTFRAGGSLVERAAEALAERPCPAESLARDVLRLNGPAGAVREAVTALLAGDDRFRETGGVWSLREESPSSGGFDTTPFAIVDVETTGGARSDRITEISIVPVSQERLGRPLTMLVNPGVSIPSMISRLTGITDEMVREAPSFCEVAPKVRQALDGRCFVAHNAAFDWRFVRGEFDRTGEGLPSGRSICTVRLARALVPGLRSHGLDSLARYFGVEIEARHRAEGDAVATALILLRLFELARERGLADLRAVESFIGRRSKRRKPRTKSRMPRSMESA